MNILLLASIFVLFPKEVCGTFEEGTYTVSLRKLSFKVLDHPDDMNANIYFGKGKVSKRWFNGEMTSREGEHFENLKIRYNIFNETLEINYNDKYFIIWKTKIKSFSLQGEKGPHYFENGYLLIQDFKAIISFSGNGAIEQSINQITSILTKHLEGTIEEISIKQDGNTLKGKIQVVTNDSYKLNTVISTLHNVQGLTEVKLISNAPPYTNFDLMEVLNNGSFKLLKKYSSKMMSGKPSILTNDEYVTYSSSSAYFISDKNGVWRSI